MIVIASVKQQHVILTHVLIPPPYLSAKSGNRIQTYPGPLLTPLILPPHPQNPRTPRRRSIRPTLFSSPTYILTSLPLSLNYRRSIRLGIIDIDLICRRVIFRLLVGTIRIVVLGVRGVSVGRVRLVVCCVLPLPLLLIWICVSVIIVCHRDRCMSDGVWPILLLRIKVTAIPILHRITRSITKRRV
jgi:hypothetical protein